MHGHPRKEHNCLNCGAFVQGRFCQNCGQENIEPKETFLGMVQHFFEDITHYDGKFFSTLRTLLFRPGFLSKEYVNGRRMRYLHPVRMYVFTSTVFFIFFFSLGFNKNVGRKSSSMNMQEKDSAIAVLKSLPDTSETKARLIHILSDSNLIISKNHLKKLVDSSKTPKGEKEINEIYQNLGQINTYTNGSGISKKFSGMVKGEKADEKRDAFLDYFLHKLPYALFLSLPLMAFILYLLYIRHKQFYFFHHGVFTVHLYIFNFIALLLFLLSEKYIPESIIGDYLSVTLILLPGLYMFLAMKNFYGQGWIKTFVKFIMTSIFGFFSFIIITGLMFVLALYLFH